MAVEAPKRKRTTLAAAVAHPIRVRCLVTLAERVASPSELAKEQGLNVTKLGYHVTALADSGLIVQVDAKPVRGALEHFYSTIEMPCIDAEDEADLTEAEQRNVAESIISIFAANATHAIDVGTMFTKPDRHLTRKSMDLDKQGWEDATAAHMELFDRMNEIEDEAAERRRESDETPSRFVSFQALFQIPRVAK